MSGGQVCTCGNRDRWHVLQYHGNRSAFNGYRWTPSDYSAVKCDGCGHVWRTMAAYVETLPR